MLNKIKLLLGIDASDKDELIQLLIEEATEEAKAYTHNSNVESLNGVICQMVVYRYNLLGTEGIKGEGYSNVSFSYADGYPSNIIAALKSKRKIILGG